MWRRALATPFWKGSAPTISTSGRLAAWAAMCSPPPNPTSSQASAAPGISVRGSKACAGGRRDGSRLSISAAWRGLIGRDLMRP